MFVSYSLFARYSELSLLFAIMDALKKLCRSRGSHKSHLGRLLESIDVLLEKYPHDVVPDSEDIGLLKQLEHKATTLANIDRRILDTVEDEHKFESMIVESEETQSLLSLKMAMISHKLTTSPRPVNTSTTLSSHLSPRIQRQYK